MNEQREARDPQPEPGEWPSQEAPNRPGPPFDDAADDGQPIDPDATQQDLPRARRPLR